MSGKQIQPSITSKSQLLGVIDSFYSTKNLLEEVMNETIHANVDAAAQAASDEEVEVTGVLDLDRMSPNSSQYVKRHFTSGYFGAHQ